MEAADLLNYYARRATEYEAVYAKPERQHDLQRLRALVADMMAEHHVLEVACGTGYWTAVLAQTAKFVLATDQSMEVLEAAQRKGLLSQKVRFVRADAYHLPLRSGQFTAVFAGFWWSHVPRQQLPFFLSQLTLAAGAGATVICVDNRFVAGNSTPIDCTDACGNTYQLRRLRNDSQQKVLKNFPSEAELQAAVEPFGTQICFTELQYYWLLAYVTRAGD